MSDVQIETWDKSKCPTELIRMDMDTGEISGPAWDAYQALSALGDPVVVAEALPELVEAAMKSAHLLKNHFEADPEGMGTMANDAALRTLTALAKLKARP